MRKKSFGGGGEKKCNKFQPVCLFDISRAQTSAFWRQHQCNSFLHEEWLTHRKAKERWISHFHSYDFIIFKDLFNFIMLDSKQQVCTITICIKRFNWSVCASLCAYFCQLDLVCVPSYSVGPLSSSRLWWLCPFCWLRQKWGSGWAAGRGVRVAAAADCDSLQASALVSALRSEKVKDPNMQYIDHYYHVYCNDNSALISPQIKALLIKNTILYKAPICKCNK